MIIIIIFKHNFYSGNANNIEAATPFSHESERHPEKPAYGDFSGGAKLV